MDDKPQKELFEFEKPKRRFRGFPNLFPKADFGANFAVMLTLEKAVFIVIAVIMLLVVVFALGVERGKSITRNSVTKKEKICRSIPASVRQTRTSSTGRY